MYERCACRKAIKIGDSLCQSFPFHYVQMNNFHFSMDSRESGDCEREKRVALELSCAYKMNLFGCNRIFNAV